jgi:hypothetical protein
MGTALSLHKVGSQSADFINAVTVTGIVSLNLDVSIGCSGPSQHVVPQQIAVHSWWFQLILHCHSHARCLANARTINLQKT